ncbi:MAG TPA: trigger factor [Bacteroidia bacterium]|nr:trigger factor [Bacteroidia bacterium]
MDITKEQIDDLNAVVKVKVGPADYNEKVEKALRSYQKKVSVPGFRPGKVPSSLVKKMYGKAVLAEEINRILSDSLYNYIRENNIEVLGNPLPKEEVNDKVDFDKQTDFEFHFDMALAPQFSLALGADMNFTEYVVRPDDKLIDNYVNDMARRYGRISAVEAAEAGDLLHGDFVELDENGEIVPGGIFKSSTVFLDNPVKEIHQELIGAKTGDKFDLTPAQISDNPKDLAGKLGVDENKVQELKNKFRFTVRNVSRLVPAELNEELFDKIYGPGVVTSPEQFREKIAEELRGMFTRDTEARLKNDIAAELLNRANLSLPDAFLKRWLLAANEKPLTQEQIDAEYPLYSRQLRWQLIENKLIRDNGISVTAEEAEEHVKQILRANMAKYGQQPDSLKDEELTATAKRVLQKEEEAKKVFEDLYAAKLMMLYRTKCTITPREVTYEQFLAA